MTISAQYGDGRSARRSPVVIDVSDGRVAVKGDTLKASYALNEVRVSEPFVTAASMLYFRDGSYCEVRAADRPELDAMLDHRPSMAVRWQSRWPVALASIALLAGVIAAGAIWGVPFAADRLTPMVPLAADVAVGEKARDTFTRQGFIAPSQLSAVQIEDIRRVWNVLLPARPRLPLSLMVREMPEPFGPNALALPDGTVILNDAMVRAILGKDDRFNAGESAALAGVLAHEIGHVEGRHSMRSLVRSSLTAALAAFLFGDFSAVAAGAPAVLLGAHHSRDMESAADAYAVAALKARGLPLTPLADLFETMASDRKEKSGGEDDDDSSGWFKVATTYLSSHPGSRQRAALLRTAERQRTASGSPH